MELLDAQGNRRYLTPSERERFRQATDQVAKDKRMFGLMLYNTGCRISEGLSVRIKDVDFAAGSVTLVTLKQRKPGVFRQVPIPDAYLRALDDAFDLRMQQKRSAKASSEFIWGWSRQHGYTVIMEIMAIAGLQGIHATPKGLRHAFAIACLDKTIPLNMVQKWMGHARLETTAIYANAMGDEERSLAARLWA